ncbi:DSC E3 ubiquitin ligase complex subunit 3 [Tolypocladium paradoxum]|uniref:DSC E3 ubiquitin ligase complex subunit 3 n=1 Tax=Tolypocladium paradoxum TaxID=94208 RepID=A0A2S4KYJ5_9HYPO|nr:DSC E3 ubiquitin ligase complex subunit 3 [Tolypocladium paradoxum]
MTPAPSAAVLPLHLTIRFSTSIPDLDLDIPSPQATTVLSLKHLLRNRLATRNRLRLIHQGRILPDSSALSAVLKPLPPPPPPSAADDAKGKGKGKAVDGGRAPVRVYVNCSIGDELSSQDLADEQAAAQNPPQAPSGDHASAKPAGWTRPRPRGFDRLLQAGFTSSEISTLRTQFASIHTERFAPDATPSPDTLRALEDGWIDSNAGELPASAASPLEDDHGNMSTVLDILIRGMMIGFFFPLGSLTWLLRQGVWSEKWQIFVGSGVVLSLTVGVVMGISGER